MPGVPTKIKVLSAPPLDARPMDALHLDDTALARGAPVSLGFVPWVQPDGNRPSGVLDAELIVVEVNGASDVKVDHNLRRTPGRFTVVHKTTAVDVYRGLTPWDESRVYFRSSAVATVTIELA